MNVARNDDNHAAFKDIANACRSAVANSRALIAVFTPMQHCTEVLVRTRLEQLFRSIPVAAETAAARTSREHSGAFNESAVVRSQSHSGSSARMRDPSARGSKFERVEDGPMA
jgi:hypothetical protein